MNPTQGTQQGQVVQPYTTPNAGTPQGAQIDQGNQDIISRLSSGNTMTPTQLQQTSQQAATAGQNIVGMQDPAFRQSYVNNSNIPAIQNNYDQLARQLYQTDKAIAGSGQYQITPQTSSEYAANPGASPLALTDSMLQDGTWRNTNQAFGMDTRKSQNDDVISLLGMLNDSLGKELTSRKNTYASTADKYKAALELANSYLFKNSDIAQNQYNQQQENYRAGLAAGTKPEAIAAQIKSDLQRAAGRDSKVSPTDYQKIRQRYSDAIDPTKFDQQFSDFRNQDQDVLFPNDPYQLAETGPEHTANIKVKQAASDTTNAIKSLGQVYNSYAKTGVGIGPVNIGADAGAVVNYQNQRRIFADSLAKALGLQRNGSQVNAILDTLPNGYVSVHPDEAFKGVLTQMLSKNNLVLVQNAQGQFGLTTSDKISPGEQTVNVGDLDSTDLKDIFQ